MNLLRLNAAWYAPTAAVSTATTATATTTASAARAALFPRAGFVHGQSPAIMLFAVQTRNGGLRLLVIAHLHESEAFAPARVAVHDDFGTADSAKAASMPSKSALVTP